MVLLSFLAVYFCLLLNENIKVDSSFLCFPDLSQDNSVYPPNLYLFAVSINAIVIPLLSHILWKSLGFEPSLVFLDNNSVLYSLLFNHDSINSSSNSIFESNLFDFIILPNILIVSNN